MMREYSITTCEGSCTPQKTADPSIAGVKKGRPLIVSTIRNHRATAAAPRQPATNPSRKIRVSCMRSPEVGWVNISPGTARARLGPTARSPTDDRLASLSPLPAVPPRRRAAVWERRAGASAAHRRRRDAARHHCRDAGVARDPLGAALRVAADVRRADRARPAPRRDAGGGGGTRRGVRSEEHTSELQSRLHLVCRLLLEKKKKRHAPYAHAVAAVNRPDSDEWRGVQTLG